MSSFEVSKQILDGVRHENMSVEWKLAKAQSLALLAVAEALADAGKPITVSVGSVDLEPDSKAHE